MIFYVEQELETLPIVKKSNEYLQNNFGDISKNCRPFAEDRSK